MSNSIKALISTHLLVMMMKEPIENLNTSFKHSPSKILVYL